jgi:hypothetical protein
MKKLNSEGKQTEKKRITINVSGKEYESLDLENEFLTSSLAIARKTITPLFAVEDVLNNVMNANIDTALLSILFKPAGEQYPTIASIEALKKELDKTTAFQLLEIVELAKPILEEFMVFFMKFIQGSSLTYMTALKTVMMPK